MAGLGKQFVRNCNPRQTTSIQGTSEKEVKIVERRGRNLLTQTGLIEDYVSYASQLTDAPLEFHQALGLNLMSVCVGRTPIDVSPYAIYSHVWTLLLGRSSKDRKSTAIEILNNVLPVGCAKIANEYSREALLAELSKTPQAIGSYDECGGLLKQMGNSHHYMAGLDDTMCSLYSLKDDYVRKLRTETFTIKNLYLNLSWATTLSKFRRNISVDDYTSGFLARFQVVYAEKKVTLPRRNLDVEDIRRQSEIKAKAQNVYDFFHSNQYIFKFEESALKLTSAWQVEKESIEYEDEDVNDAYGTIASRMSDYVTKISALYEVDRLTSLSSSLGTSHRTLSHSTSSLSNLVNSPIVISVDSVQKSIAYNDKILSVLSTKLLNLLSETEFSRDLAKLSKVVTKCTKSDGWAERQAVLPRMNLKVKVFDEILQTAVQSGEIECQTRERKQLLRVIVGAE